MKHAILILCLWLSWSSAAAQFRMIGTATWTTLTDSTYAATINFQPDLTNNGYLATQVVDGFRMFTGTEQVYTVNVNEMLSTFSSIVAVVTEYNGDHGVPIGQVMVYDPAGRATIPQAPYGNTGSTSQMQAAVDTYNARLVGTAGVDLSPYPTRSELTDSTAAIRSDFPVGGAVIDSTRLTQDSILVYYQDGAEVGRDTIAGTGGGGGGVADNLGDHTMTQNLQTNGNWISGDGGNEGISVDASGNATTSNALTVQTGIVRFVGSDSHIGYLSGNNVVSPNQNTFLGYESGKVNVGFQNTFIGGQAGRKSTGSTNTIVGSRAGEELLTGSSVTLLGALAGQQSTSSNSSFVGYAAGRYATGSHNTIIGSSAGNGASFTGASNSILGAGAGASLTTGFSNVLIGRNAAPLLSTGSNNTIIGTGNAILQTSASSNNIIGTTNGLKITDGERNTVVGSLSGQNANMSDNILIGYRALQLDTVSNGNIVIGNVTGQNSRQTTSSIFIGNSAGPSSVTNVSSKLYISTTSGAPTIYGNLATKNVGIGQETADYVLDMGLRTGAIRLPVGTTAQRPTGANGLLRFSSTNNRLEAYYNAQWNTIASEGIEDDGSASDTTDGSGDITVSHTLGSASITVTATTTGTTFYNVQIHTKTSTTFKIRFFDAAGAAVTSTAVTADWIAKLQ